MFGRPLNSLRSKASLITCQEFNTTTGLVPRKILKMSPYFLPNLLQLLPTFFTSMNGIWPSNGTPIGPERNCVYSEPKFFWSFEITWWKFSWPYWRSQNRNNQNRNDGRYDHVQRRHFELCLPFEFWVKTEKMLFIVSSSAPASVNTTCTYMLSDCWWETAR